MKAVDPLIGLLVAVTAAWCMSSLATPQNQSVPLPIPTASTPASKKPPYTVYRYNGQKLTYKNVDTEPARYTLKFKYGLTGVILVHKAAPYEYYGYVVVDLQQLGDSSRLEFEPDSYWFSDDPLRLSAIDESTNIAVFSVGRHIYESGIELTDPETSLVLRQHGFTCSVGEIARLIKLNLRTRVD